MQSSSLPSDRLVRGICGPNSPPPVPGGILEVWTSPLGLGNLIHVPRYRIRSLGPHFRAMDRYSPTGSCSLPPQPGFSPLGSAADGGTLRQGGARSPYRGGTSRPRKLPSRGPPVGSHPVQGPTGAWASLGGVPFQTF